MNFRLIKEKYPLLLPPLFLTGLCTVLLILWNFSFRENFTLSSIKLSGIEKKLEEEKKLNTILKKELKEWEKAQEDIKFFSKKLGTSQERITEVIKEIEDLSVKSGVVPHSYGFSYGEKERKHFSSFTINFPFEADYTGVRNFLHLLELTPTFVVLNSINLSTSGEMSEKVRLQFQITTFFALEEN